MISAVICGELYSIDRKRTLQSVMLCDNDSSIHAGEMTFKEVEDFKISDLLELVCDSSFHNPREIKGRLVCGPHAMFGYNPSFIFYDKCYRQRQISASRVKFVNIGTGSSISRTNAFMGGYQLYASRHAFMTMFRSPAERRCFDDAAEASNTARQMQVIAIASEGHLEFDRFNTERTYVFDRYNTERIYVFDRYNTTSMLDKIRCDDYRKCDELQELTLEYLKYDEVRANLARVARGLADLYISRLARKESDKVDSQTPNTTSS